VVRVTTALMTASKEKYGTKASKLRASNSCTHCARAKAAGVSDAISRSPVGLLLLLLLLVQGPVVAATSRSSAPSLPPRAYEGCCSCLVRPQGRRARHLTSGRKGTSPPLMAVRWTVLRPAPART
jgi:hypothetical protein